VSASTDGQVVRWDRSGGKVLLDRNLGLPGPLNAATLAADGRHLITANANGTVYILRLAPGPKGNN
jgi:hypothetical protein